MKALAPSFVAVGLIALLSAVAWGQATTGNIFGTVTDKSGAAIPGATVTVTDTNKGASFSTTTNASGNYNAVRLVPDPYTVTVEAKGFQKFLQISVTVQADTGSRVDAALQIGQVNQTVEVTSAPPLLKTDRADVSTTFNERQVTDIPIVNRNFTNLQLMLPGAVQLGWNQNEAENPQRSALIQVSGQGFAGTDYLLDGTDNRDSILGIIVINPNLDAVQEVKLSTGGDYDAEFGANGAIVSAQTKSGTNQLHGEAFDYIQNDQFIQARDPFTQSKPNPATGKLNNPLRYNQFGGTFGGPIVKNKLFFFGDYQGEIRHHTSDVLTFVPTAAERTGDFSALLTPPNGATPIVLYDPRTGAADGSGRTPYPNNQIPQGDINPIATKVLGMLPLPNYDSGNPGINYLGTGNELFHSNAFDTREDWDVNANNQIFGRYSFAQFSLSAPGAFGSVLGGPALAGVNFAGISSSRDQSLALGWTRTLSPTLLTDVHFGYLKYRVNVDNASLGTDYANQLGIPGVNLGDYFTSGFPSFELDGGAGVIGTTTIGYAVHNIANNNQCNCPLREDEYQLQYTNNWTKMAGNHTIKWGADLIFAHNLRVPSDNSRNGQFFFRSDPTGSNGQANSGVGLASFELGTVSQFMRYVSTSTDARESQHRFFFYGQDSWRITPSLTLSYGLRWSYYQPQAVSGPGQGGWFDFNNANMIVAGYGPYNLQGNVKATDTDFAPRIGLAWQFTPKTVVRVGYGRSYDVGVFGTIFGHTVTQNLPVLAFQDIEPTNTYKGSFLMNAGPASGAALFPDKSTYAQTGEFPLPNGVNVHANQRQLIIPSVDSWSLSVQHELTAATSLTLTYLGNKGTHIGATPNINAPMSIPSPTAADNGLSLSPYYQKFGLTQGITEYCNCDSNNYNAFQVVMNHQFTHGLQVMANYTWARSMAFNDRWFYGWNYGYGPSGFDITHVLNISHNYDLPFGHGRHFLGNAHGVLDAVIGGWTFNGDTAIHSGLPTTPGYNGQGCPKCPFQLWPDRVGDPYSGNGAGSQQRFWNVNAFKAVPPTLDQFDRKGNLIATGTGIQRNGSAGLNSLRGPMFWISNLSLFKSFSLTERVKAQFRLETFNTFNHDNWAVPNNNIQSANFGKVSSTQSFAADSNNMRSGQVALKIIF